jgi:alkylation response protein AidB-like acyl-CoA dehydrogenase
LPPPFATAADEVAWGRDWQARLAADRWVGVDWPAAYGGRGADPLDVALVQLEYGRSRAPQLVNRVGLNLAGPTLLAHGTDEQRARFLPRILDATEIWCQLFSEPGAGSDLASLSTRAERVDSGWRVSGQKVWTSYAAFARWGICLARTEPDAPRHRGISSLVVDMTAGGVTVRPLRQITGEAEFNEVFLDGVFVPDEQLVGPLHGGWQVANTTLAHERGTTFPLKEQTVHEGRFHRLLDAAADRLDELDVADEVASSYVELRLLALSNLRMLSRLAAGKQPGPESSVTKLQWSAMTQHFSELWARLSPDDADASRQFLWSKAASIAGGTSEVQRTIIAERLLGLPRG